MQAPAIDREKVGMRMLALALILSYSMIGVPSSAKMLLEISARKHVSNLDLSDLLKLISFFYLLIRTADYKDAASGSLPNNEIQIYTWPDATLREITDILKDVILQSVKQKHVTFAYSLVYPDRNGVHIMRSVRS
jgi:hypothetical protein